MRNSADYREHKKDKCQATGGFGCFGPLDPDHVKTLGSGGSNESFNIMTLCRKHHQEKGMKGLVHMASKYYLVKLWLISNGWEFCETRRKWIH